MKEPVKIKRSNIYGVAIQYDGTVESAEACGLIALSAAPHQLYGYIDANKNRVIVDPGAWKVALSGPYEAPRWVHRDNFALEFEQIGAFFGEDAQIAPMPLPEHGGVHFCDPVVVNPNRDHMEAFDTVRINDQGEMWIDNGEYGSQVNFCPWCGKKAKKQI